MNTNDDKTPNSFDMGDDSSKSLAEIIAEEERSDAEQDKIINREKNKQRNKKIVIFSSAFLLLTGITVGTVVFNPFNNDQKVGNNEQNMVQVESEKETKAGKGEDENAQANNKDEEKLPFYVKDDKIVLPIDQKPWQEKPYGAGNKDEMNQEILKQVSDTSIGTSANTLPSESAGYTSNTELETLPDGSINPDFSYWTLETYSAEVGSYIERLINPTFGGWSSAQYASSPANKSLNYDELADMFTSDWLIANADKPYSEYMPVFADWNGNNYGMDNLLETGPRWYGEVVDSTSEFVFDDEKEQYTVDLTANIKFTAWGKDESKLEKTGTLTLKLVSNADGLNDNSSNRVLIDGASLKVDG